MAKKDPTNRSSESGSSRERNSIHVLDDIARRFEQSLKVQHALVRIASLAGIGMELDKFYQQVHEIIRDLTSAENLFIALLDHENERVTFPYYIEEDITSYPGYMDLETLKRRAITSLIVETGEMVHVNHDEIRAMKVSRGLDPDFGKIPQDWLGVPLKIDGKLIGALVIQSLVPDFRYSSNDESMMLQLAQHVASALQRQQFTESLTRARDQLEFKNHRLKGLLFERGEIHAQLKHNANHDTLTNLPNRAMLIKRLTQVINSYKADRNLRYAVLFLDLDRFKVVNDSLGHLIGDALLIEVGNRLRQCVRPSDVVSRLGGDEFCVLLAREATPQVVDRVARRILANLSQPVDLEGQTVVTSTSIGVAFGNQDCHSAEDVLRDADTALYRAKSEGKRTYRIFDQSMREAAVNRLQMEQALRVAIEDNEITVSYQPIVDIQTREIVSFEALARWNHPLFGNVPASQFIPLAEEIHLIPQLTKSVLRQSTTQICQWRKEISNMRDLGLNVNVSRMQVENFDFVKSISEALDRVDLPPQCLKLEVNESIMLNNPEAATRVVNELNARNVSLALDDFGTGYSSLSCLNSLPLDELKIDLSFVKNIVENNRSYAIIQMIVALADVMGLQVGAKGVETEAQLEILRDLGVHRAQGYLFGSPSSATSITRQLCQSLPGINLSGDGPPTISLRDPTQ